MVVVKLSPIEHLACREYFSPKNCDKRLFVSVCLSVCSHISKTTRPSTLNFQYMLSVAVARSSSDDVAIRYLLPVVWLCSGANRPKNYTLVSQKTLHFDFDHNFGKCRPIFKFCLLADIQGNFLCNCCRTSTSP